MRTRIRLHTPHRVQRGLELEERAGRGHHKCDAADRGGDDACPSLTRSIEKTLHGVRTLPPDKVIDLGDDLSAHRIGAEDEPRDSSCDQQYWRDRKQRVVGEGRAKARRIVVPPGPECGTEYWQDHRRPHNMRPPGPPGPFVRLAASVRHMLTPTLFKCGQTHVAVAHYSRAWDSMDDTSQT